MKLPHTVNPGACGAFKSGHHLVPGHMVCFSISDIRFILSQLQSGTISSPRSLIPLSITHGSVVSRAAAVPLPPGVLNNLVHPPERRSVAGAARARPVKGRVRTPETPGNMAALMTLSQVTTPDSSRKSLKSEYCSISSGRDSRIMSSAHYCSMSCGEY